MITQEHVNLQNKIKHAKRSRVKVWMDPYTNRLALCKIPGFNLQTGTVSSKRGEYVRIIFDHDKKHEVKIHLAFVFASSSIDPAVKAMLAEDRGPLTDYSLKKVKVCKWASQETTCFEAEVNFKGECVGLVSNSGHGGCNIYSRNAWIFRDAANQFCKDTKAPTYYDADCVVGWMLEARDNPITWKEYTIALD